LNLSLLSVFGLPFKPLYFAFMQRLASSETLSSACEMLQRKILASATQTCYSASLSAITESPLRFFAPKPFVARFKKRLPPSREQGGFEK
jgi:hypothetical protein